MMFPSPTTPNKTPVIAKTRAIISSTFTAHGMLCLCTSGPRIICVNETGETIATVFVDAPFSFMRETQVWGTSYLTCFLNNVLFTAQISLVGIESGWHVSPKQFPVSNVVTVAVSEKCGRIAAALNDGSVVMTEIYYTNDSHRELVFEKGADVISMFWIDGTGQLWIVRADGTMLTWTECYRKEFVIQAPNVVLLKSSVFDETTKSFLFVDGKSLTRLSFCTVSPPLCVTSSSVFSLSHGTKVAAIHNCPQFGEVIQLPPEIFPIARIAQSGTGDICVYGGRCLVVISDRKLFLETSNDVTQVVWNCDRLCVFQSHGESHFMSVYTRNLKFVTRIAFPHAVLSTPSSSENRIVMCNNNCFTVVDFGAPQSFPLKCVAYSIDWEGVKATISTVSLKWKIHEAVFGVKGDILLLLENDALISYPSMNVIENDVRRIWRPSLPDLLFIQTEHAVEVWDEVSVHEFEKFPVCSCGSDFVFLNQEQSNIGFPFLSADFGFEILQNELENPNRCFEFARRLAHLNDFSKMMNHLCLFAVQHGLLGSYVHFLNSFDLQERLRIVSNLERHLQRKLAESQFDFSVLFPKADRRLQIEIVQASHPNVFLSLVSKYDVIIRNMEQIEKEKVLDFLVENNLWSKSMRFCDLTGLDLASRIKMETRLSYTEYQQCFAVISGECEEWKDDRQPAILRMLGFTFIICDFPLWAMACLVLGNDLEKARLLLESNPSLPQPLSEYTKFVK